MLAWEESTSPGPMRCSTAACRLYAMLVSTSSALRFENCRLDNQYRFFCRFVETVRTLAPKAEWPGLDSVLARFRAQRHRLLVLLFSLREPYDRVEWREALRTWNSVVRFHSAGPRRGKKYEPPETASTESLRQGRAVNGRSSSALNVATYH